MFRAKASMPAAFAWVMSLNQSSWVYGYVFPTMWWATTYFGVLSFFMRPRRWRKGLWGMACTRDEATRPSKKKSVEYIIRQTRRNGRDRGGERSVVVGSTEVGSEKSVKIVEAVRDFIVRKKTMKSDL